MLRYKLKLDKGARISKAHLNDYCYDCRAIAVDNLAPNVYRYHLGIYLQPTVADASHINCVKCLPKSGIWKHGMMIANSPGIVDSDEYTGEITCVMYHVLPELPAYNVGDDVCQICFSQQQRVVFDIVKELDPRERGAGREGSTTNLDRPFAYED